MTDELTSTGLNLDDFETVRALVVAELRSTISSILDVSADQPIGQLVNIVLEKRQELSELLQEIHSAADPDQASGQSLDGVCSYTGTYRDAATKGTVTLTLNLDATTTVPAGSIAAVTGDADNQWILDSAVTSTTAGDYPGAATASETGAIQALAGTITTIVTAVSGWNTVTNAADATPGEARETDTDLRVRREVELQQGGATTIGAIVAEVSAIDEVLAVVGYQNTAWYVQDTMPPKSVEIVYWAGTGTPVAAATVTAIATAIQNTKAATTEAYGTDIDGIGTTYETVTDDYGSYDIGFTVASDQTVELEYTLTTDSDYPGDTAFKAAIAAWADANLSIGDDVLYTKMIDVGYNTVGITNLSLRLRLSGGGWGTSDLTIGSREIAQISTGDITVL